VSDFGFFIQEFVLEPYGADVFGLPVSVTTSFNVTFGAGMVLAMVASGGLGILNGHFPARAVLQWANGLGAAAFAVLTFAGITGSALVPVVAIFVLGAAKGLYNTGLSHRFTTLARPEVAGVLMGAWGAVGGFAMALGGLAGGAIVEGAASLGGSISLSYSAVFAVEALLLLFGVRLLAADDAG
jgi:BCD family chlorophyll transporter-like MFS transporter